MNIISEIILKQYQIRRGKAKNDFIGFICNNINGFKVEEARYICNNRNLIYGDIKNANVLVTAHYDTCANSIYPNIVLPETKLPIILIMIFSFMLGVFAGYLNRLTKNLYYLNNPFVITVLLCLIIYLLIIKPIFGKPNKKNYNDNSSGVIAILELIISNINIVNNKVAFVLFDNEEYGLLGSRAFRKKHKDIINDKLIINLDCISDGDTILVIHNQLSNKKYNDKINESFKIISNNKKIIIKDSRKSYFSSDHKSFPMHIGIGSFNKTKKHNILFINRIHTNKDIIFDEENIELINKCIVSFINVI